MKIIIIDSQGGGLGRSLIEAIHRELGPQKITAIGTNSIATAAMLRAGALAAATGENAIIYNCANADVIVGPIGIAFANSMYGEISPAIAAAVSSSEATKLLIPNTKCNARVIGVVEKTMTQYIEEVVEQLKTLLSANATGKTT